MSRLSADEIPSRLQISRPTPEVVAGIDFGDRPITALAFARFGAELIVAEGGPPQRDAGAPGRLVFYDLTGKAPRELEQQLPQPTQDMIGSFALLSDDEDDWLVGGGQRWDQSLKLWRRTGNTWRQVQSIADFSPWWHRSLQFSRQRSDLATVSGDSAGPVRLWRLNRQQQRLEPRAVLKGPDWAASALAFSDDGHFLAAGLGSGHHAPNDGQIFIWDLFAEPSRLVAEVSANSSTDISASNDVTALAWLDGDHILVSGNQQGELNLWRKGEDGKLLHTVQLAGHSRSVRSIIPLASHRFLTAGDDGHIKLWSNSGEERREWQFGKAGSVVLAGAISGHHFAAGLSSGRVYVVNTRLGNND
ncbi:MAG TPA: WD40 repeat domain-containing protein [Pirellulales bacterium]|nr:WD40 repeat domain-containing protein [Pirellulales bacterium]